MLTHTNTSFSWDISETVITTACLAVIRSSNLLCLVDTIPCQVYQLTNIMFFTPTNVQSSSVRNIQLNPATNQVIAQFKNNSKTYLYENVSADAIIDVFFGEIESLGKFVNAYCKGNESVTVG